MRRVFLGAPFFALAKSFIKRDNIGMEKFEVLVTDVSFRNDENGFTVLQVRLDNGVRTSAVGVMPAVAAGERAVLTAKTGLRSAKIEAVRTDSGWTLSK